MKSLHYLMLGDLLRTFRKEELIAEWEVVSRLSFEESKVLICKCHILDDKHFKIVWFPEDQGVLYMFKVNDIDWIYEKKNYYRQMWE